MILSLFYQFFAIINPINFHLYHYAGNNPIRYVDPDGRIIANIVAGVAGAVIGGLVGAATTYMMGGDTNAIKAAAIGGAIGGATAGFTLGASLIAGAVIATGTGAVVAAGTDIGLDIHDGNKISGESVLKASLGGAAGGLAGFAVGHASGKAIENMPKQVSIDNLEPNPEDPFNYETQNYNSNALSDARNDIKMNGKISEPLQVKDIGNGKYQIQDGHHRWWVAKQMGLEKVPVQIIE